MPQTNGTLRLPLSSWTSAELHAALERSFRLGDTAHPDPDIPGAWLISSSRQDGSFYLVHPSTGCDCHAATYSGKCRHFARAAWEEQNRYRAKKGMPLLPKPPGY
jgi:hypothetical protein